MFTLTQPHEVIVPNYSNYGNGCEHNILMVSSKLRRNSLLVHGNEL